MLVAEDMELWERFRAIGVSVEDFCIPWFSSIFMASFPTSHRNQMLDRCIAYARLFGFVGLFVLMAWTTTAGVQSVEGVCHP